MTADVRMRGFKERTPLNDVFALIDEKIAPLGNERAPFSLALGRILGESLRSPVNIPAFPKSAMDGYAVRAADLPGTLRVTGELMAADRPATALGTGEAFRIMTGAQVPQGADAVVMVERTRLEGDQVTIDEAVKAGQHVLRVGEDLSEGAEVLNTGRKLLPQDVAMLVAIGALEVQVRRKPRVRIIPTGTELVRVGAPNPLGHVVESNSFMLEAMVRRDGAEAQLHPIVADNEETLRRVIAEGDCDLTVVTGGSSVGKEDLGPVVVRALGSLPVHGIHVKPASPTGLGFIDGRPILLAPGYPVAAMVAWDLFGRRIVQRMLGRSATSAYPTRSAPLSATRRKPPGRAELHRVRIVDGAAEILAGGAALLSTATRADGFVILPAGTDAVAEGEMLEVHLFGG